MKAESLLNQIQHSLNASLMWFLIVCEEHWTGGVDYQLNIVLGSSNGSQERPFTEKVWKIHLVGSCSR
jgi:hypothetical protein